MKKSRPLLIVDGQNYAWKAFHAYSRLSHKGQGVGIVYGLPSMIGGLLSKLDNPRVIIAWEGKKSAVRQRALQEVNGGYKGKRDSKRLIDYDDFILQKGLAQMLLCYLGISQAVCPMLEGDDLVYLIHKVGIEVGYRDIIIASSDKDFHQLIQDKKVRIRVWNDRLKNPLVNTENCSELFGYKPDQLVDYLTLTGDKSDNIPGYGGIGEKKATDFLNKYGSIDAFLKSGDSHPIIKRDRLLEQKKLGKKVIDLAYFHRKFIENSVLESLHWFNNKQFPRVDLPEFQKLTAKYGIKKLMGESFIKKFKQ